MNRSNRKPAVPSVRGESISSDKPLPPKRRDRAGKQRALIRAALQLFASKGYEPTTTREIAAVAGCAEGLIHRYFKGKAGLLPALAESRISDEVTDLSHRLCPAATLEEEFLQLVAWEVDRAWETRDFLRVFIPRAMVDPSVSGMLNQIVISGRNKVFRQRLECFPNVRTLPREELDALVQAIGMFGLIFGFMRPNVLRHERALAKEMAATFARIFVRGVHL